jgi:hypothetical protein
MHLNYQDTNRLKAKGKKKMYQSKRGWGSWGGYTNIRKINFRAKHLTMDEKGLFMMIKWSICPEDITILTPRHLQTKLQNT